MSQEDVIFYLVPRTPAARVVLDDPSNTYLVDLSGQEPRFAIGHYQSACGRSQTIVTIGRDGDIVLRDTAYSREQCSFEIDPMSQLVMFRDESKYGTSAVHGENSTPFLPGRSRKVVVRHGLNTHIGMGGEEGDHIMFEVEWAPNLQEARQMVEARNVRALAVNPRLARTDSGDTNPTEPTGPLAFIHPELPEKPKTTWHQIDALGAGAFGEVHSAVDVYSGKLLAVKNIRKPPNQRKEDFFKYLKREIGALGRIEHPFVVDYIDYDVIDDPPAATIVMGLMQGSLHSLLDEASPSTDQVQSIAHLMLSQMLQALDCLDCMGIIHRDVKPENILYTQDTSGSQGLIFKLGDFGLCNHAAAAHSRAGTPAYMAPEISSGAQGQGQTPKADIWSLFLALVWVYDFNGFRNHVNSDKFTPQALLQLVRQVVAPGQRLNMVAEMARLNPSSRASAAQMMVKLNMFAEGSQTILCSYEGNKEDIPAMPADEPPSNPHPGGQPGD